MGAVFALFAAFYFWAPKIVGKTYSEFLGKIHF
jgi:cytochrome c oxidase subunit 1